MLTVIQIPKHFFFLRVKSVLLADASWKGGVLYTCIHSMEIHITQSVETKAAIFPKVLCVCFQTLALASTISCSCGLSVEVGGSVFSAAKALKAQGWLSNHHIGLTLLAKEQTELHPNAS